MIKINNLSFNYKKHKVFENINLELPKGKIVALLGPNGQGKTTLMKLIAGYLPPESGECLIDNNNSFLGYSNTNKELFFVPDNLTLPELSIESYANLYSGFYSKFDMVSFKFNIEKFDLKLNQHCQKLSYGEQKKVIITFALATNCDMILFDESINGLDIKSKKIFRQIIISAMNKDKLFIISTHQIRDIDNLFDQVLIINNKQVVLNSSTDALESNPLFKPYGSIENLYLNVIES